MSKDLRARFCQKNKENIQKKSRERYSRIEKTIPE